MQDREHSLIEDFSAQAIIVPIHHHDALGDAPLVTAPFQPIDIAAAEEEMVRQAFDPRPLELLKITASKNFLDLGLVAAHFVIGEQIAFGAGDVALDLHVHIHDGVHGNFEPVLDLADDKFGELGGIAREDAMVVDSVFPIDRAH